MLSQGTFLTLGYMARSQQRPALDRSRLARIRRDDSLDRISKITKTLGIGVLAVTGVLGLYLSKALPGHQAAAANSSTSAPNGGTAGSSSAGASSGSLSPPSAPPVQSQQPAPVVSGAT